LLIGSSWYNRHFAVYKIIIDILLHIDIFIAVDSLQIPDKIFSVLNLKLQFTMKENLNS